MNLNHEHWLFMKPTLLLSGPCTIRWLWLCNRRESSRRSARLRSRGCGQSLAKRRNGGRRRIQMDWIYVVINTVEKEDMNTIATKNTFEGLWIVCRKKKKKWAFGLSCGEEIYFEPVAAVPPGVWGPVRGGNWIVLAKDTRENRIKSAMDWILIVCVCVLQQKKIELKNSKGSVEEASRTCLACVQK
jgi:hypothetical protein